MRNNSKRTIWVEEFSGFNFISLFIEAFFSGATVRYDEKNVSGIAAGVLGILKKRGLCKNFYMAKLTLDKKDAAGFALTYQKEKDFDLCLNKFCRRYIPTETERFKSTVKLYISLCLNKSITFITMVTGNDEFKEGSRANVFYITKHPLNSIIKDYYQEKGYLIKGCGLPFGYFKYFLRPCLRLLAFTIRKFFPKRVKTNIPDPKPSVWVEYYHHHSLGFPFHHNCIDREKFDIVCYLDRHDGVPVEDEIKAIEGMDLKWVDLRLGALDRLSDITAGQLWKMSCAIFYGDAGFPFWFRIFQFEFRMQYLLYKAVFSRFKVKVLLQHQDWSWVQEAQKRALEDAGGIMLGYHWSNCIFYKQAVYFTPQHVYFVWGKMMYEYLQKRGDLIRHVLPAGIWFGPSSVDSGTISLRGDLKFIMAIFDSGVVYNIHQSEETLAKFYLKILKMLEENSGWGGIIKSRTWSRINDLEFLPHGKEIVRMAALLIQENRLVFLNRRVSPVTAAAHANISVCYGLNSAGIVSGIYGHRAIHCDSSGWLHYPVYKDPSQQVIFKNLEEMAAALSRASRGDSGVGDFSKWEKDYNYFGDFNGKSRIGDFISLFMENVSVSKDPLKSLDLVADRYKKMYNIENAFFKDNGLWENE